MDSTASKQLLELVEDLVEEEALLHDHDAELVLLAEPDDLLFIFRLPAAAAVGPVVGDARRREVRVRRHVLEHDVRRHELVVLLLVDLVRVLDALAEVGRVGVDRAAELLLQGVEGAGHGHLELDAVLLGHGAREREGRQVPADADAHGQLLGEAELLEVEDAALADALMSQSFSCFSAQAGSPLW